jgi:hypothetical protein
VREGATLGMPENNAMTVVIDSDVVGLEQDKNKLIVIVTKTTMGKLISWKDNQVNG